MAHSSRVQAAKQEQDTNTQSLTHSIPSLSNRYTKLFQRLFLNLNCSVLGLVPACVPPSFEDVPRLPSTRAPTQSVAQLPLLLHQTTCQRLPPSPRKPSHCQARLYQASRCVSCTSTITTRALSCKPSARLPPAAASSQLVHLPSHVRSQSLLGLLKELRAQPILDTDSSEHRLSGITWLSSCIANIPVETCGFSFLSSIESSYISA